MPSAIPMQINEETTIKEILESDAFTPGLYTARSVHRQLIVLGTSGISRTSLDTIEQIIKDSPWWRIHSSYGRSGWEKLQVGKAGAEQIASKISSATIRAELASNRFRPGEAYSISAILRGVLVSTGLEGKLSKSDRNKISILVKQSGWVHNDLKTHCSRWTKPGEDKAPIPEPKPAAEDRADARLVRIEAMLQAICLELSIHLAK